MKNNVILSAVVFIIFVVSGCWKKQGHEITAPKTPVYSVSGTVLDMDTSESLTGVVVELMPVDLLYEYDFDGARDTTDETGAYSFEKITPGSYTVRGWRNAYAVIDENLVVEHRDKQYDLFCPRPLLSRIQFGPPVYQSFKGICWKEAGIFAGTAVYRLAGDSKPINVVMTGDYSDRFYLFGSGSHITANPSFYALTYLGRYWTTDGENTIYSLDPARGNVDGETITGYKLQDLASDRDNIYATTASGKIVQFGNHPSIVNRVIDLEVAQPYGLAWNGETFWVSDFSTDLIRELDEEFQIKTSYRPFAFREGQGVGSLTGIFYMAFDPAGDLWASDQIQVYKIDTRR